MKFTVAVILPFIAAVVATPMASTDDSALAARTPSLPGCNYVIECNSGDICQSFESLLLSPCFPMDIDEFILHQQLEDMEEDEIRDEQQLAAVGTTIIVLGAIEARRLRAERRKLSLHLYCRRRCGAFNRHESDELAVR
ncbi:hypothetical protein K438DRAFT_1970355 [Mycena galopus ATCC 62051]|nr:hypothetical protein K438DRAFT_1970355 [Mycena galopus ATCC 62051]